MRLRWEALHEGFTRSVTNLKADKTFLKVRERALVLSRFESPAGLVEFLTSKGGSLDAKDAAYASLVRAVQARDDWADLAAAIMWCGLWPALDGIYRRRLKHFLYEPEELVSAISIAFTSLIEELDLGHVHRLAATLVRSTERDLMDTQRREWGQQKRIDYGKKPRKEDRGAEDPAFRDSDLGVPFGLTPMGQVAWLQGRLLDVIGEDGDLLIAVLVLGEDQRKAGESLGVSHDAARKRLQRAVNRLRAHLEENLSHSALGSRVSGETRKRNPGGTA